MAELERALIIERIRNGFKKQGAKKPGRKVLPGKRPPWQATCIVGPRQAGRELDLRRDRRFLRKRQRRLDGCGSGLRSDGDLNWGAQFETNFTPGLIGQRVLDAHLSIECVGRFYTDLHRVRLLRGY